jgi:hypothetical protein
MKLSKSILKSLAAAAFAVPVAAFAGAGTPQASFNDHPELYRSASPQQTAPAIGGGEGHAFTVLPSFIDHAELYRAATDSRTAVVRRGDEAVGRIVAPSFNDNPERYGIV